MNNNINSILNTTTQIKETLDNTPPDTFDLELEEIRVPVFVRCNQDGEPEFDDVDILVWKSIKDAELLKYQRLAEIEAIKCKPAVAVVPEWWQVRLEGGVPQFIIAFGEVDSASGKCNHAKYSMTIPHFKNVKPLTCPVPRYKKGNYELIAYFSDNSKIIINAVSEHECERIYFGVLPYIEDEWRNNLKYKVGKRVSYPFKEVWVCPRFGRFFSLGNRELNPDWSVYF
ncbi:MAG: hypothetical protein F6K62_16805 [Sphaerospermopsis sp. SIO1G2]|nr:hypothetical protein [Sphaerospermopsis sp. SIO1G2]